MKRFIGLAILASSALTGVAHAATVFAVTPTPTLIGVFGAGSYQVTTTGIVSLTGSSDFLIDADGIPAAPVTAPGYPYFNPDGSYTADGNYGPAGTAAKIGALAGTLSADGSTGYFLLGTSSVVSFASPTTLYGLVNDTFYPNNTGSFEVSLTAVPEPATWALMIFGVGAVGCAMRRSRPSVRVRFA